MADNPKHITRFFPYEGFINHLRFNGFTVGVHSYMRLQELLNHLDTHISVEEIKYLLCPVFASNPEEQTRFIYLFDNYFAQFGDLDASQFPEANINTQTLTHDTKTGSIRSPRQIWAILAAVVVSLIILGGLGFAWYGYRQYQDASHYYEANGVEPTFFKKHTFALRKILNRPQPCDFLAPDFSYEVTKAAGKDLYDLKLTNKTAGKKITCSWKIDTVKKEDQRWHTTKYNIPKGTYPVKLTVKNAYGCTKSLLLSIPIGIENTQIGIHADFVYKINGLTVSFFDSSSVSKGVIKKRKWNFGDASPINNNLNPTHTYKREGRYTVSLEVTDGEYANTVFLDIILTSEGGANATPAYIPGFNSMSPVKYGKNPNQLRLLAKDIENSLMIVLPILVMIGAFFWLLYRKRKRDYITRKEPNLNPPFVWNIHLNKTFSFYDIVEWSKTATTLRRREEGDKNKLDIQGTLKKTIEQGGYIDFTYKAEQQPVEYLFLIDRASFKDHQAIFYQLLAERMSKEDIYIDVYFYNHHFQYFWKTFEETPIYLEEIISRCPNHKLVIIGDGAGLLDPSTGNFSEEIDTMLTAYPHRALMSTVSTADWGRNEGIIENRFVVLPAKVAGFAVMADRTQRKGSYHISQWIDGSDGHLPDFFTEVSIEEIRIYLGEDLFRWFSACAIYPELQWELTLHIGEYLSERFHSEKTNAKEGRYYLLSEAFLLRLIRLPYFRKGGIPEKMRLELVEDIDRNLADDIRKIIVNIIEANMPPAGSLVADKLKMNIVLQKWQMKDAPTAELKEDVQHYLERNEVQDYVVLEKLKTATGSKISEASKWQNMMRSTFFREGIPLMGIKSEFIAVLCVLLVFLGFFSFWWNESSGNMNYTDIDGTKYYIATEEDSLSFYNFRGVRFYQAGSYGSAINDWNSAIQKNPFVPEFYYNRGLANYMLFKSRKNQEDVTNLQNAITDFRFASAMIPAYNSQTKIKETYADANKQGLMLMAENGSVMAFIGRSNMVLTGLTADKPIPVKSNISFESMPKSMDIDPSGGLVAVGQENFSASVIDLNLKKITRTFNGHKGAVTAVAISSDAHYLATGAADKKIMIWDIPSQSLLAVLEKHNAKITTLKFSNDNTRLISGAEDKSAIIWDIISKRPVQLLEPNEDPFIYAGFGKDGNFAFTVSDKGLVKIWNEQGVFYAFSTGEATIHAATVFPEGNMVAVGGEKGQVKIFELSGNQVLALDAVALLNEKIPASANPETLKIQSLSFSQNGEWLSIGTNTGTLLCKMAMTSTNVVTDTLVCKNIATKKYWDYGGLMLQSVDNSPNISPIWLKNVWIPYHLGLMYYENNQFTKAYSTFAPIPFVNTGNFDSTGIIRKDRKLSYTDSLSKTLRMVKGASGIISAYQSTDSDLLKNTVSDLIYLFSRTPSDALLNYHQQYIWVKCIDQAVEKLRKFGKQDSLITEKACIVQNLIYKNYCSLKSKYESIGIPGEGYTPFKQKGLWGYLDERLEPVIPPIYKNARPFSSGLAMVSPNEKASEPIFIDKQGEVVYDKVGGISEERIPVMKDGRWGYLDLSYKTVISPRYLEARVFINGLAIVNQNGLLGYIDGNGNVIINPLYEEASPFTDNGLAEVKQNGREFYIDLTGKEVKLTAAGGEEAVPVDMQSYRDAEMARKSVNTKMANTEIKYEFVGEVKEGFRLVRASGLYGFIDMSGKPLTGLQYQEAIEFSGGRAGVKLNNKWGFIDNKGLIVIPVLYSRIIQPFMGGRAQVEKEGKSFFIDQTGNCLEVPGFSCEGASASPPVLVSQDLQRKSNQIVFKDVNEKWGLKDEKGNVLLRGTFDNIPRFVAGVARVKQGDKWGFLKLNGKLLTELKYDETGDFGSGLAPVKQKDKWGYIDLNGKEVIPLIYEAASSFKDNKALVTKESKNFYINPQGGLDTGKKGGITPEIEESIPIKISEPPVQEKQPPTRPVEKVKAKIENRKNNAVKPKLPPEVQQKMDYYQTTPKK